jgi:hypothetical protein
MVSEPMVSMLSLDGLDKWSLDIRFREEIVFGGLISNLRMFLSVNGLLGHVTKLRGVAENKTSAGMVFDQRERECSTLGVLEM